MDIITPNLPSPKIEKSIKKPKKRSQKKTVKYLDQILEDEFLNQYFNKK